MKNYVAAAADDQSGFALLGLAENSEDDDDKLEEIMQENVAEIVVQASTPPTTASTSTNGSTQHHRNHCHSLLLSSKEDRSAEKMLWIVAFISFLHIAAQLVGGILANSLAIIADSGHILTDLISFLVSIFMIRISTIHPNRRYTFGYLRAEFIGALASIFIIWIITILMIIFATQRIIGGDMDVDTGIMIITAIIGIVFNLVMVLFLKCSKNAPALSHGHSHFGHHVHENDSGGNVNVRAAFIHVLGDFIQSIGVLFAALLIRWTGLMIADPLCTYLFSFVVIGTSYPVAKDIFFALMETTPSHLDYNAIKRDLNALSFVSRTHSLHIWSLSSEQKAAVAHLIIEQMTSPRQSR